MDKPNTHHRPFLYQGKCKLYRRLHWYPVSIDPQEVTLFSDFNQSPEAPGQIITIPIAELETLFRPA